MRRTSGRSLEEDRTQLGNVGGTIADDTDTRRVLASFNSPPPLPRARLLPMDVAVTVTVAILVTIAALLFTGILAVPSPRVVSVEGEPIAFSEAYTVTSSFANRTPGGPWILSAALGFGASESGSLPPLSGDHAGCLYRPVLAGNLELPATPSWAPTGYVSSWSIFWTDSQGAVLETDADNVTQLMVDGADMLTGACVGSFTQVAVRASSLIDSTNATRIANVAGGSTWLAGHVANETVLTLVEMDWLITYSTCSPYQLTGSGSAFSANVSAVTGNLNGADPLASVACSSLV